MRHTRVWKPLANLKRKYCPCSVLRYGISKIRILTLSVSTTYTKQIICTYRKYDINKNFLSFKEKPKTGPEKYEEIRQMWDRNGFTKLSDLLNAYLYHDCQPFFSI